MSSDRIEETSESQKGNDRETSKTQTLNEHNDNMKEVEGNNDLKSHSDNPPLFHDLSSGRLVKLDNFSFDDTPNHFNSHSIDPEAINNKRDSPVVHEVNDESNLNHGTY